MKPRTNKRLREQTDKINHVLESIELEITAKARNGNFPVFGTDAEIQKFLTGEIRKKLN